MAATEERPADPAAARAADVDISLVNVTKRFDDVVAVDALSLEIESGTFFALLGPSGCGKTTTLRMIGGFEEPTSGRILLGGRDVTGLPPYKRDANTVFQNYALFPHLSIFDNVAFGLKRKKVKGEDLRRRVRAILRIVGLEGYERRRPRQLSGGQQQRVALARALVNRPQVLLLDEPLGALDLKLRRQMQLELKLIQHDMGITFVHVTHDQEEAMTMADVIAVMNHGRIEQLGSPTELYERPRTAFVAGFLGVSNLLHGTVVAGGRVRLETGEEVAVSPALLEGRSGRVSVGVRPEKLRLGEPGSGENALPGRVKESAYVGVSTQYVVETAAGELDVYAQNARAGEALARTAEAVTVSWSPECTFIVDVDAQEKEEKDG
jgi:spermidine/putrescine transport system ATP-binding protein